MNVVPVPSQLAVFDFDGTLADSLHQVLDTYNLVAGNLGLSTVSHAQMHQLRRLGPREVMRELSVPFWKAPQIMTAVRTALRERMGELEPYAGIVEMLRELWQRGVKTAIVSSNAEDNVRAFLSRHRLDGFDVLSCGVSLFGKTSRLKSVQRRREFAGLVPFYVGDEVRDVAAASASGMRSVAVSWGYSERGALEALQPDYLVHTPAELLSVLAPT
jgi:phosphoglycolate phosphatase